MRVAISPNSTHALLGHGVVDALNQLPVEGRVGSGLPVVIPPVALEPASHVLYEADRHTYGRVWEFVVEDPAAGSPHPEAGSDGIEYRVRVDNREFQVTLARLQYLLTTSRSAGLGAWIRI